MCGLKSGCSLLILNCIRLLKHIAIRVIRICSPGNKRSPTNGSLFRHYIQLLPKDMLSKDIK